MPRALWLPPPRRRCAAGAPNAVSPFTASERGTARPHRRGPELLLDAQELVVLGGALPAGERARLDLPRVDGHREVRDERVLCFPRAVRDDSAPPRPLGQLHRFERLRE